MVNGDLKSVAVYVDSFLLFFFKYQLLKNVSICLSYIHSISHQCYSNFLFNLLQILKKYYNLHLGGKTHKTFSVLPLELALINTEIVQLSEMVNIGIGCFEFCTESKKYDLDESPKGYA